MEVRPAWLLLSETLSDWKEDKASRLAAALSYYTVFAMAPVLVVVIALAGAVFGHEAVRGEIHGQIAGLIGPEGAQFIEDLIRSASRRPASAPAAVLGVAMLVLGATGFFVQLQDAMNTIWEVTPRPGRGIRGIVHDRLASFAMVVGVGFLLMVSLVISAGLSALTDAVGGRAGLDAATFGQGLNFVLSLGVTTLLFAMVFRVLPDVRIEWNDVWIGALVTAMLFSVGKMLIGLYLGRSAAATSFGAASTLAIILLWVYYSAQILFLGAEFTQVYARRYGSRIVPDANAIAVTNRDRAQQGIA